MSELPPFVAERYEYVSLLGKGGMGNVYLAKDKKLPRQVAIKIVSNELAEDENIVARIRRESQLHGKITSHPNIVTLIDLLEDDGKIALVLEYVDGETLCARLQRNLENEVTFSQDKSVSLVQQLLSALQRLHAAGVVHRDIKPENLMLGKDDNGNDVLKLMDFGIAKSDADDLAQTMITKVGHSTPGTPAYMSPEQIDQETFGDVTPKSDLYSVGVILYEMLIGSPPFKGTLTQIFTGHLTQPIKNTVDTSKLPPYWINLICKALEKEPDKRFQSAEEFSNAFNIVNSSDLADAQQTETRVNNTVFSQALNQNQTMLWDENNVTNSDGGTQLFDEENAINDLLGKNTAKKTGDAKTTKKSLVPMLMGLTALVTLGVGGYIFYSKNQQQPVANVIETPSTTTPASESEVTTNNQEVTGNAEVKPSAPATTVALSPAALPVYEPITPIQASPKGAASSVLNDLIANRNFEEPAESETSTKSAEPAKTTSASTTKKKNVPKIKLEPKPKTKEVAKKPAAPAAEPTPVTAAEPPAAAAPPPTKKTGVWGQGSLNTGKM